MTVGLMDMSIIYRSVLPQVKSSPYTFLFPVLASRSYGRLAAGCMSSARHNAQAGVTSW